MLDIKLIREKPEFVRQRLATRGSGEEVHIDELLKLDEQRRKFLAEVESLKSRRNRASKEIGALMAQKKIADAEAAKKEAAGLGNRIDRTGNQQSYDCECHLHLVTVASTPLLIVLVPTPVDSTN